MGIYRGLISFGGKRELASLGDLIDALEAARNKCIQDGQEIRQVLKEDVPLILNGNLPFEGSSLEYILCKMNKPENQKSLGWGIIEGEFIPTLNRIFTEAHDTDTKRTLVERIKEDYHYDVITMHWVWK